MSEGQKDSVSREAPSRQAGAIKEFRGQVEIYVHVSYTEGEITTDSCCPCGAVDEETASWIRYVYTEELPVSILRIIGHDTVVSGEPAQGDTLRDPLVHPIIFVPEEVYRAAIFADDSGCFDEVTVWRGPGEAYVVGLHGITVYLIARIAYGHPNFLSGDELLRRACARRYAGEITFFRNLVAVCMFSIYVFVPYWSHLTWGIFVALGIVLVPLFLARMLPLGATRLMVCIFNLLVSAWKKFLHALSRLGVF